MEKAPFHCRELKNLDVQELSKLTHQELCPLLASAHRVGLPWLKGTVSPD